MTSVNGPPGQTEIEHRDAAARLHQTIECQLFESLVHHLIEKGVLTQNDALSVVQTVVQVHRGALEEHSQVESADSGLAVLKRLYTSFEMMSDRRIDAPWADDENVVQLRPPLHDNRPQFDEN